MSGARRIAISGSTGGLGRGIAQRFHDAGDSLLLIDTNRAALDELRAAHFPRADILICDQTHSSDIDAFSVAASDVDVFINNAAMTLRKPLEEMSHTEVRLVLDTNAAGPIAMAIAAARGMLMRKSGVIVNVTSQLAFKPTPGRATYGAAKAALVHFTRTAASEWIGRGVRVVGIAPGPIDTPMVRELLATPEGTEKLMAGMPIGRLMSVSEIAESIHFLTSPAASGIVGEVLVADGGNLLT
ncbi:SDR family NAD(P)-dependent oxidoreductase [Ottowia thiooxydans]|uniref:SDR family NAD(P)-dependent oxidoreductase n=1 Tax=Ottowia thiooxydans TaxID=219182 RepID=UPI000401712A|nr:SDR family oxidoreductase [Ottowia thiooxydans]